MAVLDDAGEVGVARTGTGDDRTITARRVGRLRSLDVHRFLPVLPVSVRNQQRDGAARRFAVPYAAQGFGAIGFNRHPPAAPTSALPPAQLRGHRVEVDRQTGGHAFEDRDERLAVRLTSRQKSQHERLIVAEKIATSGRLAATRVAWCRVDRPGGDLAPARAGSFD